MHSQSHARSPRAVCSRCDLVAFDRENGLTCMLRKPAMHTISKTSSSNKSRPTQQLTQLMQRCLASTKSRTYCFAGGSDFTTQNGAARNVKGLLHHKCSSQQWPVVPLLFVCCLPAMHSLLCAAAC